MGDTHTKHELELRREADELLTEARAKLEQADRLDQVRRGRYRRQRVDSLGRRWYGHLWVVSAFGAVLSVAWQAVRRPQVAMASAAGAAGIVAAPVMLYPAVPPPAGSSPPPVVVDWGGDEPREPAGAVEERHVYVYVPVEGGAESADSPVEVEVDGELPEPAVMPTYQPTEPEPTAPPPAPKPGVAVAAEPTLPPVPVPVPSASVTVEPNPPGLLDHRGAQRLCGELGHVGLELRACVLAKLGE